MFYVKQLYRRRLYKLLNNEHFKYVIIGKEKGGKNGTPHLQGYAELISQMRFNRIKREINDRMHFERRYGTQKQAIIYCKKENWEENGIQRHQGERTDLLKIREQIKHGVTQRELLDTYEITSGALRVIDRYYTYLEAEKREKPNVYWVHGERGTVKTKWAYDNFKDIYWKYDTKWWEGYDRYETIVIDDFRASHMKFNCLLRLLDSYPYRCEIKGGYRRITSKNIIRSNRKPSDIYNLPDEDIKQLLRRIDKIYDSDNIHYLTRDQTLGNTMPTSDISIDDQMYLYNTYIQQCL
jgi:hypothetical protein